MLTLLGSYRFGPAGERVNATGLREKAGIPTKYKKPPIWWLFILIAAVTGLKSAWA